MTILFAIVTTLKGVDEVVEMFETETAAEDRLNQYADEDEESCLGIVEIDDTPENSTLIMSYLMNRKQ